MDVTEVTTAAEELVALNKARAGFYRMLSYCFFKELTQEQVERLATIDFSGMSGEDQLIAEGLEDMRRYLYKLNTGTRQELAVDYAHTFLDAGNYQSYAATPYESVFTSEAGILMQEARDEVYKMYCEQHMQPQEGLHTPEDHVSFEFEFIANLLDRTNESIEADDWAQALQLARTVVKFQFEHQVNWLDALCDAIDETAKTRFYRGLGKVARGWVHLEQDVCRDEAEVVAEALAAKQRR